MTSAAHAATRILGVDPGLRFCGLGVIEWQDNHLRYLHSERVVPKASAPLAERLLALQHGIHRVVELYQPHAAALEETFVSVNGQSTLKLGQARGAILLALAQKQLPVAEYAARFVKKSVTGSGTADKEQMMQMVKLLLPQSEAHTADEADALALAITHAHQNQALTAFA